MGYLTEPQPKRMVAPMIEYECDHCQKRYKSRTASNMLHLSREPYVAYLCSVDCLMAVIVEHEAIAESFSVAQQDYKEVISILAGTFSSRLDGV